MSHSPDEPFWRYLLRAFKVIGGVSLFVLLLHHGIWFRPFEDAALDAMLLLKEPRRSADIVIVGIDDEDYNRLFRKTSPLDPRRLADLIAAVAAGQPRLIGVDLDTSDPRFRDLQTIHVGCPVVWGRDALQRKENGHEEDPELSPQPVLGGGTPEWSGIALLPQDSDGVVRRYRRTFPTRRGGTYPSFAWQILRALPDRDAREERLTEGIDHDEMVLNFAGDRLVFDRVNSRSVLAGAQGRTVWAVQGPLRHKIVLLGGLYRAARDEYVTPVGLMAGVELMALAVQSDREGGGIRPLHEGLMFGLEIMASVVLVYIHWLFVRGRLRLLTALLLSLVAIPVLALAASLLAFSSVAYWMNAIPILAAVLIHQLYDHAEHYRELYLKAEESRTGPMHATAPAGKAAQHLRPLYVSVGALARRFIAKRGPGAAESSDLLADHSVASTERSVASQERSVASQDRSAIAADRTAAFAEHSAGSADRSAASPAPSAPLPDCSGSTAPHP
jgi:CHASE2 domain-containing sensor protein